MSLMRRTLPALYNGVSQQPAILRAEDQTEYEENTWATLADGVSKRPPTFHVARLTAGSTPPDLVHVINRDASESYVVIVIGGVLRVFDATTGAAMSVAAPLGWEYLADSSVGFSAVTIADYTFIVNRAVKIALAEGDPPEGTGYVPITPGKSGGGGGSWWDPGGGGNPLPMESIESLEAPNASEEETLAGAVVSIEKLPETAPEGAIYLVQGSSGDASFTSFYVKRVGSIWEETVAPGHRQHIDPETMPHALVRNVDGTFTFAPYAWAARNVGSVDTNPPPSFVGRPINDVFFYQNRLCFLSDENTICSCAGDFGNFWRNTVLDYVDTDVVDVSASTTGVNILRYAVPFTDGVMLYADRAQFSLTNGEAGLSTASVAVRQVSAYPSSRDARPAVLGTEIYFASPGPQFAAIREYTRGAESDNLQAADVTAHVPAYIPKDVVDISGAPAIGALFVAARGNGEEARGLYVYQVYWSGNDKVQSAWRRWTFGSGRPLRTAVVGDSLFLVLQRPDGVFLERMGLMNSISGEGRRLIYMDRQAAVAASPTAGGWAVAAPFAGAGLTLAYDIDHPTTPGGIICDASDAYGAFSGSGTVPTGGIVVGEPYKAILTLSRQFPNDARGQNVATGRLQLRTLTVSVYECGPFDVEVYPYGDDPRIVAIAPPIVSSFTARGVGDRMTELNRVNRQTDDFTCQIYAAADACVIRFVCSSLVGCTWVCLRWEGFYVDRAA